MAPLQSVFCARTTQPKVTPTNHHLLIDIHHRRFSLGHQGLPRLHQSLEKPPASTKQEGYGERWGRGARRLAEGGVDRGGVGRVGGLGKGMGWAERGGCGFGALGRGGQVAEELWVEGAGRRRGLVGKGGRRAEGTVGGGSHMIEGAQQPFGCE